MSLLKRVVEESPSSKLLSAWEQLSDSEREKVRAETLKCLGFQFDIDDQITAKLVAKSMYLEEKAAAKAEVKFITEGV